MVNGKEKLEFSCHEKLMPLFSADKTEYRLTIKGIRRGNSSSKIRGTRFLSVLKMFEHWNIHQKNPNKLKRSILHEYHFARSKSDKKRRHSMAIA